MNFIDPLTEPYATNAYQMPYYKDKSWFQLSDDIEAETADTFFPDDVYEMLHRTMDTKEGNKRFIRSSLNPDFHFEIREKPGINFWVECKFMEIGQFSEKIELFTPGQLIRYKSFGNAYLFLSVKIQREQYYYFVPFNQIKTNEVHFSFLNPYSVTANAPVKSELLYRYMRYAK